ncbi:MAG: PEP-CTERM sorting domain-containing protein [Planctomycetota bacterium]|nr:PEP-CTERM sorting domain-containing protein [Planctomycetota bacterium]
MKYLKCAIVVGFFTVAVGPVLAIPLVYEEGANIGQVFTTGEITIKMTAFDVGTVYPALGPAGTSVGYSGPPGAGVGGGVTAVDGIAGQTPASGALPVGVYPGPEDTWGIGKITRIQDANGDAIWTSAGKQAELTVYFWGEQDFFVEQMDSGNQRIDGVGMHFDIYEEPLPSATAFNATGGTASRTPANTYPTVTDGILVLSGVSAAGFINGPGVAGGLATEFESRFNATSLTGDGEAYISLIGGTDMAQFDTDYFISPFGLGNADFRVQFDTSPTNVADWLVTADDPVKGYVPEPASLSLLILGGLVMICRRRR